MYLQKGNAKVNEMRRELFPFDFLEETESSPPISSASDLAIVRPSPVPP